jgi:hypothetical protein
LQRGISDKRRQQQRHILAMEAPSYGLLLGVLGMLPFGGVPPIPNAAYLIPLVAFGIPATLLLYRYQLLLLSWVAVHTLILSRNWAALVPFRV